MKEIEVKRKYRYAFAKDSTTAPERVVIQEDGGNLWFRGEWTDGSELRKLSLIPELKTAVEREWNANRTLADDEIRNAFGVIGKMSMRYEDGLRIEWSDGQTAIWSKDRLEATTWRDRANAFIEKHAPKDDPNAYICERGIRYEFGKVTCAGDDILVYCANHGGLWFTAFSGCSDLTKKLNAYALAHLPPSVISCDENGKLTRRFESNLLNEWYDVISDETRQSIVSIEYDIRPIELLNEPSTRIELRVVEDWRKLVFMIDERCK